MWSNAPYMKLLMMEVLPVPWSPKKTALCLLSGATCGRRAGAPEPPPAAAAEALDIN